MESRLFILLDCPELNRRVQKFLFGCGLEWQYGETTVNKIALDRNLVVVFDDGVAREIRHTRFDIHNTSIPSSPNNHQIDLRKNK